MYNLWSYILNGGKRASVCWHRRYGKDDICLNLMAIAAHQRVGTYWHMCPEKEQVRKAVWDSLNNEGVRRIDQAFPKELRRRTLENEMKIELLNGSMINFLGSDRYDSNVGTNPIWVTFSEWSLCDPKAWTYISPILAAEENKGVALFIFTPRGLNHAEQMHRMAENNPDWFAETLTVADTTDHQGRPIISQETIEAERREGKPEHEIRQEYYCEFLADNDYQLIPIKNISDACNRPPPPGDKGAPTIIGYDVGISGDPSVRAVRTGYDCSSIPLRYCREPDLNIQADLLIEDIERFKPDAVFVDETGVGYGLVPILRQRGYGGLVMGINFGSAASSPRYKNIRAEMYDTLRIWCESPHASLVNDLGLKRELGAIRYDPNASTIKIASKADIKKDVGHSTDAADAIALTHAKRVARRDLYNGSHGRQTTALM